MIYWKGSGTELMRWMLEFLKEQGYEEYPFPLLSMEEYTDLVAESIRLLPEEMVLHRMTGDGPGDLLIAPDCVRNKKKVLNTINRKIASGLSNQRMHS